jgi:hypothetical protein
MLPTPFFRPYVAMCGRIDVDPVDLLSVAANESRCDPAARNRYKRKDGVIVVVAAGLWQLTAVAAPGVRWIAANLEGFAALSAEMQLPYWERYFAPHKGKLVNAAAAYVCTYLPALLDLAGNPDALLCSQDGRTDSPYTFKREDVIGWYAGNLSFDPHRTGEIRVHQLTEAIARSCAAMGDTWTGYVASIHAAQPAAPIDVTDGGDDAPVFVGPPPSSRDPEEQS